MMPRICGTRVDLAKGARREAYLKREARLQALRDELESAGIVGPRTPPRSGLKGVPLSPKG